MSYGGASDEVAEDFKLALEDLTMNSRYEISNLTVIAKENTEHALAISEALKEHIKKIAPAKKLPALYLLDSIAKNVGTPYTLFFGRQLYMTFMESYALVDNGTRRKMEEMLKTWKEPVPGSIDSRPVFAVEVTRPIENALIKARTSAIQANQQNARSQHLSRVAPGAAGPYRNTPTPPNSQRPGSGQFPPQGYGQPPNPPPQQYHGQQNVQTPYGMPPQQPAPRFPTPPAGWHQPAPQQGQGYGVPDDSLDTLNSDIARLIDATKSEFAQNPYDGSNQTRLKALLDLQIILSTQKLPQEQINQIRDQVKALSAASRPPPPPQPVAALVTMSQSPAPAPLASLLSGGPAALAALLANAQNAASAAPRPSPSPAPAHANVPTTYTPPIPPAEAAISTPQPASSLLDQLRAAGLLSAALPASGAPPSQQHAPPPQASSYTPQPSMMPQGFLGFPSGFPPPPILNSQFPYPGGQQFNNLIDKIQLTPASLKIPRPHLTSSLYDKLGVPCSQCGRRFTTDEQGRAKKLEHMDWHFKVNQRTLEAETRGQHRSWFVDELDWICSREIDESHLASADQFAAKAKEIEKKNDPKLKWIPVPDDPERKSSVCPICMEKFEMKWSDDEQEFVWMDALDIGRKIYHASCHEEAKKDGTPPPPVLGKRKNEENDLSVRTKIKTES